MTISSRIKKFFTRKPKFYLLHDKYEIIEAFKLDGESYYMHKDPMTTLAGRGLTSLVFTEELLMRCDVSYLKDQLKARKQIMSDPKKIDLTAILKLDMALEERVNLLAAVPDQVYKMASVVFWTGNESPFKYDVESGARKIEKWKAAPEMYNFFLQGPLKDLIPSLGLPEQNSSQYLAVVEKINEFHLKQVRDMLSSKASPTGIAN